MTATDMLICKSVATVGKAIDTGNGADQQHLELTR